MAYRHDITLLVEQLRQLQAKRLPLLDQAFDFVPISFLDRPDFAGLARSDEQVSVLALYDVVAAAALRCRLRPGSRKACTIDYAPCRARASRRRLRPSKIESGR